MYRPTNGPAPSDADAEKAWAQIMQIAEANALILRAYGGVATLATPRSQREADGLRERVLRTGLWELEK
jgi:hypothetical protein